MRPPKPEKPAHAELVCPIHGVEKRVYWSKNNRLLAGGRWDWHCAKCTSEGVTRQRLAGEGRSYTGHREKTWRRHGIKDLTWDRWKAEATHCRICGEPGTPVTLLADHDHATGLFRGALCRRCNILLGYMESEHRPCAVAYLEGQPCH